eukprot:TRINITY_DN58392_c0_g1_i1.p1 TRINITY_DN58392_c0_g1~~TRINITY_DN58392_c0_g1_i1.p1  ORF type:complete len:633 (+),score=85.45 TRINITY_DN58392_c0_g1_i1:128-2026(+)
MPDLWKVVGGSDKGGILVREGESTKSTQASERLASGAIVEQVTLTGDRLCYKLLKGAGPKEGWISTRLKGLELAIRISAKELERWVEPPAPAADKANSSEGAAAGLPEPEAFAQAVAKPAPKQEKHVDERIAARCKKETARPKISWKPVDVEWVDKNHMKRAPGVFYGLEFPWNEDMLLEFGAKWLTKAFHAAGTLDPSNAVTEIVKVKRHVFGNNGGKTLFEVMYKRPEPHLHTKLFAKYPFDMTDMKQRSDSVAQRVYKQPQDFTEVNFYRLMEVNIPFRTPKYYYGDISNESTNFILITEQVPFDDPGTEEPLAPFQIEGPYDKAMDPMLRGPAFEYYYILVKKGAIMAALHKTGKLAPQTLLDQFDNTSAKNKESFGMHSGITGDAMFQAKLKLAATFMFDVASKIFPPESQEPSFRDTWLNTMRLVNAYAAEHYFWRHGAHPDYVAFTHQNLNVDNAFFWRDEEGKLDAGIFDWGNQRAMSLGHMFYWWVYTAEWETLRDHTHPLIDFFIDTFHKHGGPQLDKKTFFTMFIITALEHNASIVPAVSLIFKMCPKKQFETITSRKDDRIFKAIDGKSTCRVYLHCWCNILQMFSEWSAAEILDQWVFEHTQPPFSFSQKDMKVLYQEG